jgi:hypothetical protein
MSRSRKKHPAGGISTAPSDKDGKQRANRAVRRAVKVALVTDPARELLPESRAVANAANFPKDGKAWYGETDPRFLRK